MEPAIAVDLRDTGNFKRCLLDKSFRFQEPTIILIECVLSYIDRCNVINLLSFLSKEMHHSLVISYDPVCNLDDCSFASMLVSKFKQREAEILFLNSSVREHSYFIRSCNWNHVYCSSTVQAMSIFLTEKERNFDFNKEPFDEYASLAVLNNIYAVSIFSNCTAAFLSVMDLWKIEQTSSKNKLISIQSRIQSAESRLSSLETFNLER